MYFEIVGQVSNVETMAVGRGIRTLRQVQERYGPGRWRKLKGVAVVRLANGRTRRAEVHWYEVTVHGAARAVFFAAGEGDSPIFAAERFSHWAKSPFVPRKLGQSPRERLRYEAHGVGKRAFKIKRFLDE